jgi:hypothetical protein
MKERDCGVKWKIRNPGLSAVFESLARLMGSLCAERGVDE